MFDRWLPQELEFASDVCSTLNAAIAALDRLGFPILHIWQPMTMGGLHMRQAESLQRLRDQLYAVKPKRTTTTRKGKARVSGRK